MTRRIALAFAGAVVAFIVIYDRAERARLDRARAAKDRHWDELAAQNRAKAHPLCPVWALAPILGRVSV